MRVLIAADSFKDALSAVEVCEAIAAGLAERGNIEAELHPLADGGEGTLDVLARHLALTLFDVRVHDPLRRERLARVGMSGAGVAYVELAQAAGLQLLDLHERSPLTTCTVGVGELMLAAQERGTKRIVLAVGGSATCDAGVGLLSALGWTFLDRGRQPVDPSGGQLQFIEHIVAPRAPSFALDVLCDVDNPLFGPNGAAYCYAPQKGATKEQVECLDRGLQHFARCAQQHELPDAAHEMGAGAAGGVGYAARVFLNANLHRGIDFVLDATNFDAALRRADLVITGEGRLDAQTLHGKLIAGVCARAKEYGAPVIALCGQVIASAEQMRTIGLESAYDINEGAAIDLTRTAERLRSCAARIAFPF